MLAYLPNILTLFRIALVPILIVLLEDRQYEFALIVFVVAGLTDALDGFVAKRFDAETAIGALLDPLADKALLITVYVMLSVNQIIPFWLMVVVVFRDAIIVGGYLLMQLFFGAVTMQPLFISKVNTFLQIAFVVLVLMNVAYLSGLNDLIDLLEYLVLITSVVSGSAYVFIWSRKATDVGVQQTPTKPNRE